MSRLSLLVLPLVVVACGDPAPLDANDDTVDADGKADGVTHPLGSYRVVSEVGPGFATLVLMEDGAFLRLGDTEIRGRYRFTSSGSYRYIRFYEEDAATLIDRYAWTLDGERLAVRRVNTSQWYDLDHIAPACAWWSDCAAQGVDLPGAGAWSCEAGSCAFAACAFGSYYTGSAFEGAPGVILSAPQTVDAAHPATGTLLGQILDAMSDFEVSTFAEALDATDDAAFIVRTVMTPDRARYTMVLYYAGDNLAGAIYVETEVSRVAVIGDQSIYECTVP